MYKDLQIAVAKHPHPWIVLLLRQKKELKMMMMMKGEILKNKFLQYYHFHNSTRAQKSNYRQVYSFPRKESNN